MAPDTRKKTTAGDVTLIDFRIGLNLLGENGRTLLAQYIQVKRQQRKKKPAA